MSQLYAGGVYTMIRLLVLSMQPRTGHGLGAQFTDGKPFTYNFLCIGDAGTFV